MNNTQQARYKAYALALAHLKENESITNGLPAFREAYEQAMATLGAIEAADGLRQDKSVAITAAKRQFREGIARQAMTIAAALVSYATAKNDQRLREAMQFSKKELFSATDTRLGTYAANILAAAQAASADLKAYGIGEETLVAFKANVDQHVDTVNLPRNRQAERKQAGQQIIDGLNQLRDQLKNRLDKLMLQYETSHPEFFQRYMEKRQIINPARRKTAVEGMVTDAVSNTGLGDVQVTVENTELVTTTLKDGSFELRTPQLSSFVVVFSKKGYTPARLEVELRRGQRARQQVALQPS